MNNELEALTQFFTGCTFPEEPTRLREGITVSNYREFVKVHTEAIRKGHKWKDVYLKRLRELRIMILYCRY